MKNKDLAIIAVIAILLIAWVAGAFSQWGIPSPFQTTDNGGGGGAFPTTPPSGMVNVDKQLKINVNDKHGGAAATGTTNSIDIYQADGQTAIESDLDLSSATVTTAKTYKSGTVIWINYYYDTTIDEYMWWKITVPQMSAADAETATTTPIDLQAFSTNSYTDSLIHGNGTSIADGNDMNVTEYPTSTLTYSWYGATDNCGFMVSHDPVYDIDLKAQLWVTLTGSGYETVTLNGFDGKISAGSTHYYYKTLNPDDLTKWKVGNNYVLSGSGSFTFSYSATGYTTNSTVLQVYLKLYSNEGYFQTNVDYGPYDFTAAEQTLTVHC